MPTLNAGRSGPLTSVKRSLFRHPAAVAAGAVVLALLLVFNAVAAWQGTGTPWLLATAIVADVLVVGLGILVATREVLVAEAASERMEQALTGAQARLAAIVDSAMDAVITVDRSQTIVLFNKAAETLFGLSREEALGTSLERLIPARFRGAHHGHVEQFGRTGATSRKMGDVTTLWALRADGSEFPIEASISHTTEGEDHYFTVILRDITRRKQAEDALRRSREELRELSARVLEAREEEKTRIARELHDELGQLLTALKMDLAWLRERLPPGAGGPDLAGKAEQMQGVLEQTVSSTRRIAADLRPLMLDDLGLADAATWLVSDFSSRSGVRCDIRLPPDGAFDGLPGPLATAVYRALQESLTNIARHSGAKHAWVILGHEGGDVQLEVEDDGRGIAEADLGKVRSLGLKGMRERVTYLGGTLDVARAPRGGTRVRMQIPVPAGPV